MSLTDDLPRFASESGIDLLGVTSARPFLVGDDQRVVDPRTYLPDAQSLIVTACYVYHGPELGVEQMPGAPRGRIGAGSVSCRTARHYSEQTISGYLAQSGHSAVISNRLPFKMAAVRSRIAYYGKNCLVHADGFGSYLQLGCVITDAPLETVDLPTDRSDCRDCTACMDACPSGAIDRPYHVVRERCVSLWLGNGLPIAGEFRDRVGDRILRCDACHTACPRNRGLHPRTDARFRSGYTERTPKLIPLLLGDDAYYAEALPGFSAHTSFDMLRRNVCIALGNTGDSAAVPALIRALSFDHIEIRSAAAWALGRIGTPSAVDGLTKALDAEPEPQVRIEIADALTSIHDPLRVSS